MLLLGFCCKVGTLGGVEVVTDGALLALSSFTQLGLGLTAVGGLGKAGLESERLGPSGVLWKGGFFVGPLASEACKGGCFKGGGTLLKKGLLLSSWEFANLLARPFVLLGSCTSVSLLVDTVLFSNEGLRGMLMAPPDRLSITGFLGSTVGPEERVGCRAVLGRTGGAEELSSVLAPPVWKRANMALTSPLFSMCSPALTVVSE